MSTRENHACVSKNEHEFMTKVLPFLKANGPTTRKLARTRGAVLRD